MSTVRDKERVASSYERERGTPISQSYCRGRGGGYLQRDVLGKHVFANMPP